MLCIPLNTQYRLQIILNSKETHPSHNRISPSKISPMTTYCDYCNTHPEDTFNRTYHDTQYGFPITDDNALFERLILEINQAGLSWITILKKAENFRRAYSGFDIEAVAAYDEADRARLLADAGIIRNRLKVNAAIENARRIRALGSFKGWLDANHPRSKDAWTKLFKKNNANHK